MGGSLRNPASFCNVVGLRPAPGRVPVQSPIMGWSALSVAGPMARTVEDLALLLSAMAGPDDRSPISLTEPGSVFGRPLSRDFKGVRIAWARDLGGIPFDPRVTAVVNAQRKSFESLGCIVEEAEPDFAGADEAFKTFRGWTFEAQYGELLKTAPRPDQRHGDLGSRARREDYRPAARARRSAPDPAISARPRVLREVRFLRAPGMPGAPIRSRAALRNRNRRHEMETYIDWMRSCYYISITSHPAISVPAGFTPEGLPVGLQIVGRHRGEWPRACRWPMPSSTRTERGQRRPLI